MKTNKIVHFSVTERQFVSTTNGVSCLQHVQLCWLRGLNSPLVCILNFSPLRTILTLALEINCAARRLRASLSGKTDIWLLFGYRPMLRLTLGLKAAPPSVPPEKINRALVSVEAISLLNVVKAISL